MRPKEQDQTVNENPVATLLDKSGCFLPLAILNGILFIPIERLQHQLKQKREQNNKNG